MSTRIPARPLTVTLVVVRLCTLGALAAPLLYDSRTLATVRPSADITVSWIPEPPPRFQTALAKWVSWIPRPYSVPSVLAEHRRPDTRLVGAAPARLVGSIAWRSG